MLAEIMGDNLADRIKKTLALVAVCSPIILGGCDIKSQTKSFEGYRVTLERYRGRMVADYNKIIILFDNGSLVRGYDYNLDGRFDDATAILYPSNGKFAPSFSLDYVQSKYDLFEERDLVDNASSDSDKLK